MRDRKQALRPEKLRVVSSLAVMAAFVALVSCGRPAQESNALVCFSDLPEWTFGVYRENARARFAGMKKTGADMVRVSLSWSMLEPQEGVFDDSAVAGYFDALKRSGLQCKLILGVVMDPPAWYLAKHPELRMTDQFGCTPNYLAPWAREQWPYLENKTRELLEYAKNKGILEITDEVVIDLGPAGECIYPPNWTLGLGDGLAGKERKGEEGFFLYSAGARKDFVEKMQAGYGTIAAANAAWKTDFPDWLSVEIPKPNTSPGKFWEDVLTWYRDAKRDFATWRIRTLCELLAGASDGRVRGLVYLPGADPTPAQWEEAIRTGGGNIWIRLMTDNAFLMKQAFKYHCTLQMTGAQIGEVCRTYLAEAKASGIPSTDVWLENAGEYRNASDPLWLAELVKKENLRGFDFTHTRWAVREDRLSPREPLFSQLAAACKAAGGEAVSYRPEWFIKSSSDEKMELLPRQDATILAGSPDTNAGLEMDLNAGLAGAETRALLRFELPELPPNKKLAGATLKLSPVGVLESYSKPPAILVSPLTRPWHEHFVTWNQADDKVAWNKPGGDFASSEGPPLAGSPSGNPRCFQWDVTQLVKAWHRDPSKNFGLLVRSGKNDFQFPSRQSEHENLRPILELRYD